MQALTCYSKEFHTNLLNGYLFLFCWRIRHEKWKPSHHDPLMELISWLRSFYNAKPEFRKTYLPIPILVYCINHVINFLNFKELDNTFKKSFDLPGMISVRVDSEEQTSSHLREYSL